MSQSQSDPTARRDYMLAQAIRGLLLIQGGAAIAFLAFLRAAWTVAPRLVPWIASSLTVLLIALIASASVPFLRSEAVLFWSAANGRGPRMMKLYRRLTVASFFLFFVSMAVTVIGVFLNLPTIEAG